MSTPKPITALNGRTLYIEYEGVEYYPMTYFEERTCHAELNERRNAVVCSECGTSMFLEGVEEFTDWGGNAIIKTFKTYPYCPNCGARVIRDNEPVEVWQQASADDVTCYGVE